MKGSVLALLPFSAAYLSLTSACASAGRPPEMPAWTPEVVDAAPARSSQDGVRVPRHEELPELWPAQGLYVGGAIVTTELLGDFDGDEALFGPTDVVIIPDLDIGGGIGVYVSYRWRMDEVVLQYTYSEHDGEFDGSTLDHDATIENFDLNWRHYFLERSPLQPYGLLGIGMGEVEVENGSTDQATGTIVQDADFEDGINVNVGAGVALYTLPWVCFWGQGMYRFGRFKTSDGIDGEFSNEPDVDSDAWEVSFGAAIRLLPPRRR